MLVSGTWRAGVDSSPTGVSGIRDSGTLKLSLTWTTPTMSSRSSSKTGNRE